MLAAGSHAGCAGRRGDRSLWLGEPSSCVVAASRARSISCHRPSCLCFRTKSWLTVASMLTMCQSSSVQPVPVHGISPDGWEHTPAVMSRGMSYAHMQQQAHISLPWVTVAGIVPAILVSAQPCQPGLSTGGSLPGGVAAPTVWVASSWRTVWGGCRHGDGGTRFRGLL